MHVALSAEGAFLSLVCEVAGVDRRRPLQAGPAADLARRYALARERSHPAALLALGRELHAWLDGAEGWLAELRPKLVPPFVLEVRAPLQPDAAAWAVLHAPWELLAGE